MDSKTLRKKFLDFFEKNDHVIIPSSPLVPSDEDQLEGKEKVLFTSAGMQQLIPYLMGKPHPKGNKLADVQKCVRTDDIEEVGDATHHTFFEMLGNWSLGAYWKEEAIELSFKFLTQELNVPLEKFAVSVFAGDNDAPKDEESANKWKSLGILENRIAYLGKEDNWWPTSRRDASGELKNAFGPCGPDTEMFIWTGKGEAPEKFDPEDNKWVEVWNDVFMEFNRKSDGTLEELPQKNVDTGMGLERMLAVINGKDNDYETDLFEALLDGIRKTGTFESKIERVIADHLKASIFLILDGVRPDNKQQGYVLRRLLRRSSVLITQKHMEIELNWGDFSKRIVDAIFNIYDGVYEIERGDEDKKQKVTQIIISEIDKFGKTLKKGLKEVHKITQIDGKLAFDLYQSYGFPLEITEELFRQKGQEIDREQFRAEFEKHRELSRTASAGMFKGGLADHSEVVTKYHTATHLLHQALRDVLGPEVFQKGSNITSERLRFDFSYDKKMTPEEIKKVEEIINKIIEQDLKVDHMIVDLAKAKEMNAIGLFNEKYAEKVSIYGVGPGFNLDPDATHPFFESKDQRDRAGYYSLEFCGGPHVEHTGVIGKLKINKEEAISAGIRRIRATLV
ncbi:MAG: alanine--tRNA ligase [Candidatus Daviesbacteria bacterium]|nr:alanine--tRNA ligase [Candidatus Daviesbacteria bacterium]